MLRRRHLMQTAALAPLLGDPVYGTGSPANPVRVAIEAAGLTRQALHATILGFVHPPEETTSTGRPKRRCSASIKPSTITMSPIAPKRTTSGRPA